MRGTVSWLSPFVLLCALASTACDSFSLLDQFTLPDERLTLAVDRTTVERLIGTVGLTPSGGTAPYTFEEAGYDLYSGTNTQDTGSFSGLTYTAGRAIGRIRITVTDAAGSSAIAYVTVLPPAPIFTSGTRTGSGNTVQLEWSYADTTIIDKYRLECSVDGQAYTITKEPNASETAYSNPDNDLIPASTYSYMLYAVSGSYESVPAFISLPPLP
ncbi:MAG: hypothetical protein CVV47_13205 [Spirochaetae bacterium HGW-Spirochaetae-3]|jgi:hypothetical protein|nr:MAG: hypothetical protein CVV47_13205 [Spirochaetae bacterium HGW-Spirochaetae-3]